MNAETPASSRAVQRVRHPLKARLLEVLRVRQISPHFLRVTLGGPDLQGFVSASFDDHVKVMLPAEGQVEPVLPQLGPEGPKWPVGAVRPVLRDYTPRRHDPIAGELDLDFVLHGEGPAASWAAQAKVGQRLGVGGPRGSSLVPLDYDWHLLVGDDTALPAIARRLEELPAGAHAIAVLQLSDAADQQVFNTRADVRVTWVSPGAGGLSEAVRALSLPEGEGHAWAAGEAGQIAAVRRVLVEDQGLDKDHVRASAYWKQGDTGHEEPKPGA